MDVVEKIADDLKDESEATAGWSRRPSGHHREPGCPRSVLGWRSALWTESSSLSRTDRRGLGRDAQGCRDGGLLFGAEAKLPAADMRNIKWRLNNKSADQATGRRLDLAGGPVLRTCEEDQLLSHLGTVLYECPGEEYPEVLGSILGATKAVVNVIGMDRMTPPIRTSCRADAHFEK